jgi:hypothetical protein
VERVAFLIEDSNQRLSALLNPEGLVIRRVAGVRTRRSVTGQIAGVSFTDDPLLFTGGSTTELEMGLLFDVSLGESSINAEDVRQLTRPIWNLAERLEYFTQNGVPRRSWLRLRMLRVNETTRREHARRRFVPPTPDFWDLGYPVAQSGGPGVHQIVGGGPTLSGATAVPSRGTGGPISWFGRSESEIVAIAITRTTFLGTLTEAARLI